MNPNSPETKKAPIVWKEALKRIPSIRLSRFWEGIVVGVIGGIVATVIGTAIVNKWLPPSSPDDAEKQQIEAVIANEARFALAHDLEKYRNLFADDAWVIQVKKHKVWAGQNEIVERLRPLSFTKLFHTPTQTSVAKDSSSAFSETYTTFEQVKDDPVRGDGGKEYWQFAKIDGNWKIVSFQFDLPE
jgi:uncharacterized protein (TIGR02246 family)